MLRFSVMHITTSLKRQPDWMRWRGMSYKRDPVY